MAMRSKVKGAAYDDKDDEYRMFGRLYGCLSTGQAKWLDPGLSLTRFVRHFYRRKPPAIPEIAGDSADW